VSGIKKARSARTDEGVSYVRKNIVLCSDGTGNTAIKARGPVFKAVRGVDIQGHKYDQTLKPQVAF